MTSLTPRSTLLARRYLVPTGSVLSWAAAYQLSSSLADAETPALRLAKPRTSSCRFFGPIDQTTPPPPSLPRARGMPEIREGLALAGLEASATHGGKQPTGSGTQ